MADNGDSKALRVEELERYGKPISDMPKEAFEGQGRMIFGVLRDKFGLLGMVPFAWRVRAEQRRLRRCYAEQYRELRQVTPKGAKEITMLIAMFNVVAEKEGREQAYQFVKGIFQRVALKSLPAIYQLEQLTQCQGDVFDNFKKFNIAMFEAGDREFHVQEIEDEPDHLRIVVDRCLNVEAGKMFDCPEIAKLGCDHDLASYPLVEPRVDAEFRRPCTLAKGGCCCDFNFYRTGSAPQGPYVNQ